MPATSWIAHVKETHRKHGGTYKQAMIKAKATWKKKKAGTADHAKTTKKTRGKKKGEIR